MRKINLYKNEDKELLLKDLCSRLLYGVKFRYKYIDGFFHEKYGTSTIDGVLPPYHIIHSTLGGKEYLQIEEDEVKPYLFPLSSMTEEQKNQLKEIWGADMDKAIDYSISGEERLSGLCELSAAREVIDWLIANHFDFRGLIEKGLAIDCTNLNIY